MQQNTLSCCNSSSIHKTRVGSQSFTHQPPRPSFIQVSGSMADSGLGAILRYEFPITALTSVSGASEHISLLSKWKEGLEANGTIIGERTDYLPCSDFRSNYHNLLSNRSQLEVLQQSLSQRQVPGQFVELNGQVTRHHQLTKQLGLAPSFAKVHKLAKASGCLSLGVYGNDTVTKVEARKVFFPSRMAELYFEEDRWDGSARALDGSCASMVMMPIKIFPELIDNAGTIELVPTKVGHNAKSSTTKSSQTQKVQKRSTLRSRKSVKVTPQRRDLYRRPFQLYGIVLCYPFKNANTTLASLQSMSLENLEELVVVFNQITIGLAGSGFALVAVVALRMLTISTLFDSSKITVLVRGIGLIWLSSAVKRLRSSIRGMTKSHTKLERRELVAKLRSELQKLTFKVFTLIILLAVRFA